MFKYARIEHHIDRSFQQNTRALQWFLVGLCTGAQTH